jgi:hypothetical protein
VLSVDPRAQDHAYPIDVVFASYDWDVTQVVPTNGATYVVAAPTKSTSFGLYRVREGQPSTLVLVRLLDDPGTFTSVSPLTDSR